MGLSAQSSAPISTTTGSSRLGYGGCVKWWWTAPARSSRRPGPPQSLRTKSRRCSPGGGCHLKYRSEAQWNFPTTPGTTMRGLWRTCMRSEWTGESHRGGSATAGCWSRQPWTAYPRECEPEIGCGANCVPNRGGSLTPCGWRRRSRCSDRSTRAVVASRAWRRSTENGCSPAPSTT